MSHQLIQVVLLLVIVSGTVSGCEVSRLPTSPSPLPAAAVAPATVLGSAPGLTATYTLSGVVFEKTPTGRVPVSDVEVYCDSCGSPEGHTFASTDAEGFYTFSWASYGAHKLLVRKAGYAVADPIYTLPDGTGVIEAAVNGDTRLDIQLAPGWVTIDLTQR